eukprot:9932530-Lingulodinium_polyedra.AAC.1
MKVQAMPTSWPIVRRMLAVMQPADADRAVLNLPRFHARVGRGFGARLDHRCTTEECLERPEVIRLPNRLEDALLRAPIQPH